MNILAHRGANKAAPQNTMHAFKKALEFGANGVELDVHMTSDGHLIIIHDYAIDELSDGKGHVADMTLEELRHFDFGSYFSEKFSGTKIPTLDEFLKMADAFDVINIELKSPEKDEKEEGLVEKTIELVKEYKLEDKVIFSSFDMEILKEIKKIDGTLKIGILYSPDSPYFEEIFENPFEYAKAMGADALHPMMFFVTQEYIKTAHTYGLQVNPWTINTEDGIEALNQWGCDNIITDVPDVAYRVVNAMKDEK